MSIDYVSVYYGQADATSISMIGIVDTAKSIIWHSVYFGVGDFEVFAPATKQNLKLLQVNNFVTRPNSREVGIIEKIEIAHEPHHGMMITATGRFAKSILDRRLVRGEAYVAYEDRTFFSSAWRYSMNVEEEVHEKVRWCFDPGDDSVDIPFFRVAPIAGIQKEFAYDGETPPHPHNIKIPVQSLLTYTEDVLRLHGMASTVYLDDDNAQLRYVVYEGTDRSVSGGIDRPIVFSKDFDNLTSSNYMRDISARKTVAFIRIPCENIAIGDEHQHYEQYGDAKGLERYEFIVDATTDTVSYVGEDGHIKEDADVPAIMESYFQVARPLMTGTYGAELFDGKINLVSSQWELGKDFFLGDIVTIQDNDLGKYVDVRVTEILETQDENGYSIEAVTEIYEGATNNGKL